MKCIADLFACMQPCALKLALFYVNQKVQSPGFQFLVPVKNTLYWKTGWLEQALFCRQTERQHVHQTGRKVWFLRLQKVVPTNDVRLLQTIGTLMVDLFVTDCYRGVQELQRSDDIGAF